MEALVRIEPMTEADVETVAAMDGPTHMTQDNVREELQRPWSKLWVAREAGVEGAVVAFLVAWHVSDELHVLNVTTRVDRRRRGIGRAVMSEAVAYGRRHAVRHLLLEVRRSNRAAIAMYRGLGFFAMGVRSKYYPDDEDAVEMVLALDPATGAVGSASRPDPPRQLSEGVSPRRAQRRERAGVVHPWLVRVGAFATLAPRVGCVGGGRARGRACGRPGRRRPVRPRRRPRGGRQVGLRGGGTPPEPKSHGGAGVPEALLALARTSLEQGRSAQAEDYGHARGRRASAYRVAAIALRAQAERRPVTSTTRSAFCVPTQRPWGRRGARVRLELGELLIRSGHRADAEGYLMKFADEYGSDAITSSDAEGLAMVGRAMQLLRHPKEANRAYDESEKAEIAASGGKLKGSARVETLLWRADQFLDKYDTRDAGAVLEEAAKLAPHRADTMVMMARAELQDSYDFEAAEKLAHDALQVNPRCTGAFAVQASLALYDMNIEAADAAIASGLAVDPNDLELLSLRRLWRRASSPTTRGGSSRPSARSSRATGSTRGASESSESSPSGSTGTTTSSR